MLPHAKFQLPYASRKAYERCEHGDLEEDDDGEGYADGNCERNEEEEGGQGNCLRVLDHGRCGRLAAEVSFWLVVVEICMLERGMVGSEIFTFVNFGRERISEGDDSNWSEGALSLYLESRSGEFRKDGYTCYQECRSLQIDRNQEVSHELDVY